ncbi:hypothetical protein BGZ47_003535, partial [Haplosporangium gracile]
SGPSLVLPLKQLPIDEFLLQRDKENRPSQTSLFAQSSSSWNHNIASFSGSSKVKSQKHGQPGLAKAAGFATGSAERKSIEASSEAAASDDDDDFMPSRVATRNVPMMKKTSIKKQRR